MHKHTFRERLVLLSGLAVLLGALAVTAAEEAAVVTIRPPDTGEALVNPEMGWTMHFYSNIPQNYGSKLRRRIRWMIFRGSRPSICAFPGRFSSRRRADSTGRC